MPQEIITSPHKDFESIKKIDENGVEYWTARELMPMLGYPRWESFSEVISRALRTAVNSNQEVENHFRQLTNMVKVGSGVIREIKDWKLDRYACYLIAQNGDSSKTEIALAQTYFAIQTRKQEVFDNLSDDEKRIQKRDEVTDRNKHLFSAAKLSGVSNFGKFNDAGYKGLYTMPLSEIEKRKKIKKGELLDRAGSEELGANMFRITQTEAKLKRENIKGDTEAQRTHFDVGRKVRKAIEDIGGNMPENLKPERHIKELKKETKLLKKKGKRKIA
jgi:DNA-damage-inducible protein D